MDNPTASSWRDFDHGEFDSHWIRAFAQEGYSRWYIRPHVASTTVDRETVTAEIQRRLTAAHGPFPGKRLLRHLAFLVARESGAVHLECKTPEEMMSEIRIAMIQVAQGEFVIDCPQDPLYAYGRITEKPMNIDGRIISKLVRTLKATGEEKNASRMLVGNHAKIDDVSLGSLSHMLVECAPHLLHLNMGKCSDMAFSVRKDLHKIIGDSTEFEGDMRKRCVETIVELWDKTQPADKFDDVVQSVEKEVGGDGLYDIEPTQIIAQYINPVIKDVAAIRRRLTALELVSFNSAIQANAEHCRRLSAMWELVFPHAKIATCDALNNALSYLASVAGGKTMHAFRDVLGPSPLKRSSAT